MLCTSVFCKVVFARTKNHTVTACVEKWYYDITRKKMGVLDTFGLFACCTTVLCEKVRKVTFFSFILRLHINDFCKQVRLDLSALI